MLDGRPFLQPTTPATPVAVNGDNVASTCWLADGDEIQIGSARIHCQIAGEALDFSLGFSGVDYDTLPPEAVAGEAATSVPADAVTPLARTGRGLSRRRAISVVLALLMLAGAAFWLLTSSAVLIATDPADARVDVRGVPDLRLGGRFLLRPGRYAVTPKSCVMSKTASWRVVRSSSKSSRICA